MTQWAIGDDAEMATVRADVRAYGEAKEHRTMDIS